MLPVPARDAAAEAMEQLVGACLQNILRKCAAAPALTRSCHWTGCGATAPDALHACL